MDRVISGSSSQWVEVGSAVRKVDGAEARRNRRTFGNQVSGSLAAWRLVFDRMMRLDNGRKFLRDGRTSAVSDILAALLSASERMRGRLRCANGRLAGAGQLMAESRKRLVQRVQRELQASGGGVAGAAIPPREFAELERRARRLRESDSCFEEVCLSPYVMSRGMARQPVRGGSGLVGMEA